MGQRAPANPIHTCTMRRLVLDTNCLLMCVSPRSPYHQIWTDFVEGKVEWCVSTEVLSEYTEILTEKSSEWFAETVVNAIVNNENTVRVSPTFFFNLMYPRFRKILLIHLKLFLFDHRLHLHMNQYISWF